MRKIVVVMLLLWCSATLQAVPREIDRIIAVVNNEAVMLSELRAAMAMVRTTKTTLPRGKNYTDQVLEYVILQRIKQQIFKRAGVDTSDKILDKAIKQIADNNKLTVAQLAKVLPEQGMTMASLRAKVKTQIQQSFFEQQLLQTKKKPVSEREIKNKIKALPKSVLLGERPKFYHVYHILLEMGPFKREDEVAGQARNLVKRLKRKPSSFIEVAKAVSEAPTAQYGGDLGWRMAQDYPEIIAKHLGRARKGQIIGPIKDSNGFHIFSPLEIEGGKVYHHFSNKELRAQAKDELMQEKVEAFTLKFLKRLRRQARVEKRI
jgi:peptidyl-prolyl cis-trans isomerase SurA